MEISGLLFWLLFAFFFGSMAFVSEVVRSSSSSLCRNIWTHPYEKITFIYLITKSLMITMSFLGNHVNNTRSLPVFHWRIRIMANQEPITVSSQEATGMANRPVNSASGGATNRPRGADIPNVTAADRQVMNQVWKEANQKYGVPICIGSCAGIYSLGRFKIIKSSGWKLLPYYIGTVFMSSMTGKFLARDRMALELSRLDTPLGRYIKDNLNVKPSHDFSLKSDTLQSELQMQKPVIQETWDTPTPLAPKEEAFRKPITVMGKEVVINPEKTKPKRYNKYGDEIME